MTGADGIDIILLHGLQVFDKFFFRYMTPGNRAEFMAVHTLEYNTFSIQSHDMVFYFKSAESHPFRDIFLKVSILVIYLDSQIIKLRLFCAPQRWIFDLHSKSALVQIILSFKGPAVFGQADQGFSLSPGFCADFQSASGQCLVRYGPDSQVSDMYIGNRVQIYISVNSGKSVKILVLAPAAGSPFKHLGCQLVFSFLYIFCQFKF